MSVEKTQCMIDYMLTCPAIQNSPLFFNFLQAQEDNKNFVTVPNDKVIMKPYIDGSVEKRYTYSIMDFKAISYNPLVSAEGAENENVADFLDVQSIIDWIDEQNETRNFPNFGDDCIVDRIEALANVPRTAGIDGGYNPPMAKYMVTIAVTYLDQSKMIWG